VVERRQLDRSQSLVEGLALAFALVVPAWAGAQPAEPKVTGSVVSIARVESWSYFEPRLDPLAVTQGPIGDPDHTYIGGRAELGVQVEGARFDLGGVFNYVRLENLPTNAAGPGALGPGAFYYAATGVRYSYQLYLGELTVRLKSADRRLSITAGRMPFTSGGEITAAYPALESLKRERLHSRLIGNFEWSFYQRRFDGARVDIDRPRWHFTAGAFMPTQGGYEESTNLTIQKIQIASSALTRKARRSEAQIFAYVYRDRRPAAAVVDNTARRDRPIDVTIATIGGSYAKVAELRTGELDVLAWGAWQAGDWYGSTHRGASAAVELGHRWTRAPLAPWLRAGYLHASGDDDPNDPAHRTFFQMLPSSRQYSLSSVFAQMNARDAFIQAWFEPGRLRARIEVHAIHLANARDLWYHGSGATARSGRFFGFAGRAGDGVSTSLGTVVEGTIDVPIRKYWSINAYGGAMQGGGVVSRMFTGKRLTFWSLENVIRF
jgi:hypothetical protein